MITIENIDERIDVLKLETNQFVNIKMSNGVISSVLWSHSDCKLIISKTHLSNEGVKYVSDFKYLLLNPSKHQKILLEINESEGNLEFELVEKNDSRDLDIVID